MTDDLHRIAIHESGHAVIGELLYLNPDYVTIEPTAEYLGFHEPRIPPYSAWRRWRTLLVKCAGLIAEEMSFDDVESHDALGLGALVIDGAELWALLQAHSDDLRQQWDWFELAYAQTRRVLSNPAVWRSVENVAARLIEARTLDRGEAYDVIDAALGRSKWKRERLQMGERHAGPPQTWIESREEYRQIRALLAKANGGAAT
jgi:hypothetical protein